MELKTSSGAENVDNALLGHLPNIHIIIIHNTFESGFLFSTDCYDNAVECRKWCVLSHLL